MPLPVSGRNMACIAVTPSGGQRLPAATRDANAGQNSAWAAPTHLRPAVPRLRPAPPPPVVPVTAYGPPGKLRGPGRPTARPWPKPRQPPAAGSGGFTHKTALDTSPALRRLPALATLDGPRFSDTRDGHTPVVLVGQNTTIGALIAEATARIVADCARPLSTQPPRLCMTNNSPDDYPAGAACLSRAVVPTTCRDQAADLVRNLM